jgi:hypothetical protein
MEITLGIILPLIKFVINFFILKITTKDNKSVINGFFISLGVGFVFIIISTLLVMFFLEIVLFKFVITLFISYVIFMILEILFFLRKNKFVNSQR